jgi:hypothetical protein
MRNNATVTLFACALLGMAGCGTGPETEYGSSAGESLSGTSVLAAVLKAEGHDVEAAIKLNDNLAGWAQGIIRFAPNPGPPDRAEANWYDRWLADNPKRWLVYVVGDFDASSEYWKSVVGNLDQATETEALEEAREALRKAVDWYRNWPAKSATPADAASWFEVDAAWQPPRICTSVSGPWAAGIDARAIGLTLHEPLKAKGGTVLLAGDGKAFVIEKSMRGENRMLFIANGSFLLNEALAVEARSKLLGKLFDWIGPDRCRIALLEGSFVLDAAEGPLSLWQLLKRLPDFRWIAAQIAAAALCAALARAPRLGRPRDEPGQGPDRPAAHAEALGALLARSGSLDQARAIVARYRSWRYPRTAQADAAAPRGLRSLARRGVGAVKKSQDLPSRDGGGNSPETPASRDRAHRKATGRRTFDG